MTGLQALQHIKLRQNVLSQPKNTIAAESDAIAQNITAAPHTEIMAYITYGTKDKDSSNLSEFSSLAHCESRSLGLGVISRTNGSIQGINQFLISATNSVDSTVIGVAAQHHTDSNIINYYKFSI